MKLLKNFLLVAISVLAITTANAYQQDDDCCPPPPECECPPAPCCDIPQEPTTPAYNQTAAINVCGSWDIYVTGTFLWIEPSQEQMEFAFVEYITYGQYSAYPNEAKKFDFDWKAAFKVGLGFHYNYDRWDNYLQYTRINTEMTSSATLPVVAGETITLRDLWLSQTPAAAVSEVHSKWKLDFNIFDLELARAYYSGSKLIFRAHYGLKGGWINQSVRDTLTDIGDSKVNGTIRSKSWLIGPRAGIQTHWLLGEGFRLFGDAAASVFYQKFHKLTHREVYINNPAQYFMATNLHAEKINAALEGIVGIGYGTYFDRNNWHFDIFAGYEVQMYFNQNMMRYLEQMYQLLLGGTHPYFVITKPGNLMLQGLNVTARFDF
jgi:hypothetical protein